MNKSQQWEQELAEMIRSSKESIEHDHAIFQQYGPLIKNMSKEAFEMFESGYRESIFWSEHTISNASEGLRDIHSRIVNRSEAARKAAATRKANKAQAA